MKCNVRKKLQWITQMKGTMSFDFNVATRWINRPALVEQFFVFYLWLKLEKKMGRSLGWKHFLVNRECKKSRWNFARAPTWCLKNLQKILPAVIVYTNLLGLLRLAFSCVYLKFGSYRPSKCFHAGATHMGEIGQKENCNAKCQQCTLLVVLGTPFTLMFFLFFFTWDTVKYYWG